MLISNTACLIARQANYKVLQKSMNALMWMSGALFSFCFMAIAARELSTGMSTFEVLFARAVIGLSLVSLMIWRTQDVSYFKTQRIKFHLGRDITHLMGQYGWFVGVSLLPLSQVFALEFTAPLWTSILAMAFLGEVMNARRLMAIVLGFSGVYLIVNPGEGIFNYNSLYVIAAALLFSIGNTFSKSLVKTDRPLTILFYMGLIQLPMTFCLAFEHLIWPNLIQSGWLMVIGLTSLASHFCMSKAMQKTDLSVVVTLDFFRLPLITLVGVLFYAEAFRWVMVIGALMVFSANLINLYQPKNDFKN
jgi:drug/metabolite transporter (DMT)-like permease